MQSTSFDTVTSRVVIMAISTLAGVAAFGWVLATYQPSPADLEARAAEDAERSREANEYMVLAERAASVDNFSEAIRYQGEVIALEPYEAGHWLRLASYHERAGQRDKAAADRRKAADVQLSLAKAKPDDPEAWERAADILTTVRRPRDARNAYQRAGEALIRAARRGSRANAGTWSRAATIFTDLGDPSKARALWLEAGRAAADAFRPNLPQSRSEAAEIRMIGEYFLRAGDIDQARTYFRRAADLLSAAGLAPTGAGVPGDAQVWSAYQLGWVYRRLGDELKAQDAWNLALRGLESRVYQPEAQRSAEWYNRACLLSLTGRLDDAINALQHAVRIDAVTREHALEDEDLAPLHDDERFYALISQLRSDPSPRPWR